MVSIYVPARSPEDWQRLLAEPEKQWRRGYSARTTAHAWQAADGFPLEISELLATSENENLIGAELLLAIPEHKVPLPPTRGHPSQNDVFALAKANDGSLVSIAVEAKVSEPFGPAIEDWIAAPTSGKEERLSFLTQLLHLVGKPIGVIRYQLLHRLASAILEAERFGAGYAVLVVQSFRAEREWFEDFASFVTLYGRDVQPGLLVPLFKADGVEVFAGWANGDMKYLEA